MDKKPHDRPLQLREAAEARIKAGLVTRIDEGDGHGLQRLVTVQELSGNEIESTMLNEKLHPSQVALVTSGARYQDLFDLVPVGYCCINEPGLILQANVSAASLLGT